MTDEEMIRQLRLIAEHSGPGKSRELATGAANAIERMRVACRAAYEHIDNYSVVGGRNEQQVESQRRVFDLLRPIVAVGGAADVDVP